MLTEAIELTLFPVMMAFAASSDLLTMTIANRVSLILAGGFIPYRRPRLRAETRAARKS